MAYVSMSGVEYDRGGRMRTLLGEVRYDDGGRVRTLLGHEPQQLGQVDPNAADLPLTSVDNWDPILPPQLPSDIYTGPILPDNWSPSTESAPITGTLMPPPAGAIVQLPPTIQPTGAALETTPATIVGTLHDPVSPAPHAPSTVDVAQAAPGVLASISSVLKSWFGGSTAQASTPHLVPTSSVVTPYGEAMASAGLLTTPGSWFTDPKQEIIPGVPNWGALAGGVVLGFALFGGGAKYSSYTRTRRRRNPAELILMGANPARRRRYW